MSRFYFTFHQTRTRIWWITSYNTQRGQQHSHIAPSTRLLGFLQKARLLTIWFASHTCGQISFVQWSSLIALKQVAPRPQNKGPKPAHAIMQRKAMLLALKQCQMITHHLKMSEEQGSAVQQKAGMYVGVPTRLAGWRDGRDHHKNHK